MKKENLFLLLLLSCSFLAHSQVQLYLDDFESASGFHTDTTNSIWEQGVPQKTVIDTAHSGQKVWITDLDSVYHGAQYCHLYSPQIVIAPFDSGYISFWQFVDLDTSLLGGKDICSLSYRTGTNTNWISLGYQGIVGATNWFNANSAGTMGWHYDSSGWFQSIFPFDRNSNGSYFYQVDTVQFRFTFHSYAAHSGDGWALGDFGVYGWNMPVDLGIVDIVLPNDSTLISNNIAIDFQIKNYGNDTLYNTLCSVYIDSVFIFNEAITINNGLAPDSMTIISLTKNYEAPSHTYTLLIKCSTQIDNVSFNDTLSKKLYPKHGSKDIEIVYIEVNPSMQVGDTIYTCYFRPAYVSFKAVNIGIDTISTSKFNYYYLNQSPVQWVYNGTLAPGDSIHHTFNQSPYIAFAYWSLYDLYVTGEINYTNYTYQHSLSKTYLAIQHNIKSSSYDSLYKWCPKGGSIDEISKEQSFIISPNPTHSSISIRYESNLLNNNISLSIYGVCGKEVKRVNISKAQKSIDIDVLSLSPGLYFVRLQNGSVVLGSGKFIKQ